MKIIQNSDILFIGALNAVGFEFLKEFFCFGQERKNGGDILPDLFGLFFYVLVHCDFTKSLPGSHRMKDHLAAEFRDRHGSHLFSDLPSSVQGGHSLQTEQKIPCPDCEGEIDYEIGPGESLEDLLETAVLLETLEGEEKVEQMDTLLSLAITGGDYTWI